MTLTIDDLERLEHILDIVVEMHDSFSIRLKEGAGRFDRDAQDRLVFVKSHWSFHDRSDDLAGEIYYGPEEWARRGQDPPMPQPYS